MLTESEFKWLLQQKLTSAQLQRLIDKNVPWTAEDVQEHYEVSQMTVHNWRKAGLPNLEVKGRERPAIRFAPREVHNWTQEKQVRAVRNAA